MHTVMIVGAGQAGLQLALGLQARGYGVTVMTDRTADEVRRGRVTSTQLLHPTALALERAEGLDLWGAEVPPVEMVDCAVAGPAAGAGGPPTVISRWTGRLGGVARSLDQRVKLSAWLELFESRGGSVLRHAATAEDLDWAAARYDLTVCSTGSRTLAPLFPRDPARSVHTRPQRAFAAAYVHGLGESGPPRVRSTALPGLGELMVIPAYTHSGPCHILLAEAVPGGPLDVFRDPAARPGEVLAVLCELMRRHVPADHVEGLGRAVLTDPGAVLVGHRTPVVRRPVAVLPSGRPVLGLGDAVATNDPLAFQGGNCAAKAAAHYLEAIVGRADDQPFDETFLRGVFESWWARTGRAATAWSNAVLDLAAAPHLVRLLTAAAVRPGLADLFCRTADDPALAERLLLDPAAAERLLAELRPDPFAGARISAPSVAPLPPRPSLPSPSPPPQPGREPAVAVRG
ncbi:hypothetical protein BIV57_21355 [Mangrovactinospora gilvigrisea]|uniref:Styrene monooxygenase StyA putative substrate binding domain-containing protein n=1 Tax=Mangrovactinospora gilvigrisea TaxID=1428644 RepID=A0A1J7BPU1_9ACTN|nr:styrene monooxygenase/indole monooxygenase family protein [Mangrovactinospora gilvigrisea]OIV35465.1 hypothetical protein BIV57_21355 [Mangrovactinospora gilvigrisea]